MVDPSELSPGVDHTLIHDSVITENRFSNIWKYPLLHKEVRKYDFFLMLIIEIADLFIYILTYMCSFLCVFYLLLSSVLNGYVRAAETT